MMIYDGHMMYKIVWPSQYLVSTLISATIVMLISMQHLVAIKMIITISSGIHVLSSHEKYGWW